MKYLSFISFIVSVAALLFSYFRCEPLTAEWGSVLVGVLAILVTLLLGFNILTLIDFKQKTKDLEKANREDIDRFHAAISLNYIQMSELFDNFSNYYIKNKHMGELEDFFYIYYRLYAIINISCTNAADKLCEDKIKLLIKDIDNNNYAVPIKNKEILINWTTKINKGERFSQLSSLIDRIANITTFDYSDFKK